MAPSRPLAPDLERHRLTCVDGSVLDVILRPGPPVDHDDVDGRPVFAGRLWNAVAGGRVKLSRALDELSVADFHLLRDLAERRGVLAMEPSEERCRNCEALLPIDRCESSLETLLAADPHDAPLEGPHELSRPIGGVRVIAQRPVTVRRAKALFRFVVDPARPFDGKVVRALGVRALGTARGRVVDLERIAARLAQHGRLLSVVQALYLQLNYPLRLRLPVFCARCGAIHDVPTPSTREVREDPEALDVLDGIERDASQAFPSLEELTRLALAKRDEVFAARGVAHLELVVEAGVPPVDDGGEPLMGSYQPVLDEDETGRVRFVITLYYRTFEAMWAEAPYDVEAELRDTIDHEVEHHLHYLRGHDPLDEAERRAARRELERTLGRETVRRAEREALRAELGSIARFFFFGALFCAVLLGGAVALGVVD